MTTLLEKLQELLFSNLSLVISNIHQEQECKEYFGCNFQLNSFEIKFRKAKVTPTKVGQFVTLWKRNPISKETEPFTSKDSFNFYLILTETSQSFGFFLFTKEALIKNQILSTDFKEGKRGFRVYPNWDTPQNRQAMKTQDWQSSFFIDFADKNYIEKFESILKSKAQ